MKYSFQKNVACSQMTLPAVGAISAFLWFVLPDNGAHSSFTGSEYGVWNFLPQSVTDNAWTHEISLIICALAVYLMAELNNANMLLRVSSRMLSSMLAITLALSLNCHNLQPGLVLMLLSLMSYFSLFDSYKQPHPGHVFISFIFVSMSSLFFPGLVWVSVIYWILAGMMRSLTPRCLIASILAMLLPYWIVAGAAVFFGFVPQLFQHFQQMVSFRIGSYADIGIGTAALAIFTTILFISGAIDFYANRLLDRTRTRTSLNAVFVHGCAFIMAMALQPQHIDVLQPVLLVDTAILFGHFFTLTHTRFSHIYMIVMLVLAIVTVMLQCSTICQDTFRLATDFFSGLTHSWL